MITGSEDIICPAEYQSDLRKRLGFDFLEIYGADHSPHYGEAHSEVVRGIVNFLSDYEKEAEVPYFESLYEGRRCVSEKSSLTFHEFWGWLSRERKRTLRSRPLY